jgi:hypothetical protein
MSDINRETIEDARALIAQAEVLLPNPEIAAALHELRADIANGESVGEALVDLRRAIAHAS